jgi:hypothetical protein
MQPAELQKVKEDEDAAYDDDVSRREMFPMLDIIIYIGNDHTHGQCHQARQSAVPHQGEFNRPWTERATEINMQKSNLRRQKKSLLLNNESDNSAEKAPAKTLVLLKDSTSANNLEHIRQKM